MDEKVILTNEIIVSIEDLLSYMELSEDEGVMERAEYNRRILEEGGVVNE